MLGSGPVVIAVTSKLPVSSVAELIAMAKASPTILEPVMRVEITTSEEFMGDIMGDLSHRRGRPQGMDAANGSQVIKATVPMSEMLDYARNLEFEKAAEARDRLSELKRSVFGASPEETVPAVG